MIADEKQGGLIQARMLLDGFTDVVNECQLMDLDFTRSKFTWERSWGSKWWIQLRQTAIKSKMTGFVFTCRGKSVRCFHFGSFTTKFAIKQTNVCAKKSPLSFREYVDNRKGLFADHPTNWDEVVDRDIVEKIEYCCIKLEEWGGGMDNECKDKLSKCKWDLRK